jgi:rhodanese-related sulfurtransferase
MLRRAAIVLVALAVLGGLALVTRALRAQDLPPTMDAPSAAGLPGAGGLLVDIRTPKEQRESGTPKGAVEVPLQDDSLTFRQSFVDDVLAAAGGDHDRPVAVIDADGRRSAFAARLLEAKGFTRVFSVGEGLFGSNLGPGWVARGLPVDPCPTC